MNFRFRFLFIVFFLMGSGVLGMPRVGLAAYDIQEMTPQVKAALDSRRERFDELRKLKEKGIIGENNQGYVELLTENDEAKILVKEENKDRRLIYKTIIQQNNLAEEELEKVEKAFAQVQKEKANPGDKIQDAGGKWLTK